MPQEKLSPPIELPGVCLPLENDAPNAPPQRGSISESRINQMQLQLRLADELRKILSPNISPDSPLEATEERLNVVKQQFQSMISQANGKVSPNVWPEDLYQNVLGEIFGLGPLEPLIQADEISEIMVNGPYIVFIEVGGKIIESGVKFLDDDHVIRMIKRIVEPLGRVANEDAPFIDARLSDGSRINAAIRPCALDGPNMTIRKFSKEKLTVQSLLDFSSITQDMAHFLEAAVVARQNIIVSGGTSTGKTTLINALSMFIPEHERTVTIEDAAELQLKQRNVVRLETKKPTQENPSEITIRDCVVNALRMRPERIVVGECRSGEAFDMLQAMNTGHDGSMTTIHANSPRDCIARFETLSLMAGIDLPLIAVRKQIASAIHLIIQISRLRDGSRKVTQITEIQGMEGDTIIMSDIFKFVDQGDGPDGKAVGQHAPCGIRPKCITQFKQYGYDLPASTFMG